MPEWVTAPGSVALPASVVLPASEALPASVVAVLAGRPATLVWRNEAGGLTFEVGTDPDRSFVKWLPAATGIDPAREIARLRWAAAFTPVPHVLSHGSDPDGAWLETAALPGRSAADARWRAEPARAVRAVGAGLRALHDALPVEGCPFSWSAAGRVDDARRRGAAGHLDPRRWHEVDRTLGVSGSLAILADVPPVDRLVVCQGDACAPNTLVGDDGDWSAHVDLGDLGIADRWADLAVATWSATWTFGPGWEGALLAAYGVDPDPERTAWYRLLWDLGP